MLKALVVTLIFPTIAAFAADWQKVDEKDGIQAYRREYEGSKVISFRGVTEIDAPLSRVMTVLLNIDRKPEWIDKLNSTKPLQIFSPFHNAQYLLYDTPPLVSRRDFVMELKTEFKKSEQVVFIEATSVERSDAPPTAGVRAHLNYLKYILKPLNGGQKTSIDAMINTDPKGLIPNWLVTLVQKSWPIKSLKGLQKQVKKSDITDDPAVVNAVHEFLKN